MELSTSDASKLLVELSCGQMYETYFLGGNDDHVNVRNVSTYPQGIVQDFPHKFFNLEISTLTVILAKGAELCTNQVARRPIIVSNICLEHYESLKQKALSHLYFAVCDATFCENIKRIKKVDVISVSTDGYWCQRANKISVISVSTNIATYLFDIKISGRRHFDMGLKEILESEDILKIVYGGRQLAYTLFSAYKIRINNVYDCLTTDISINRRRNTSNDLSRIRPFPLCVKDYFKLPPSAIPSYQCKPINMQERPLTDSVKIDLALKSAYLFTMRLLMDNIINEDHKISVNCISNSLRLKCDEQVRNSMIYEIPEEFLKLYIDDNEKEPQEGVAVILKQSVYVSSIPDNSN